VCVSVCEDIGGIVVGVLCCVWCDTIIMLNDATNDLQKKRVLTWNGRTV
jgi:hypothetical protein